MHSYVSFTRVGGLFTTCIATCITTCISRSLLPSRGVALLSVDLCVSEPVSPSVAHIFFFVWLVNQPDKKKTTFPSSYIYRAPLYYYTYRAHFFCVVGVCVLNQPHDSTTFWSTLDDIFDQVYYYTPKVLLPTVSRLLHTTKKSC
jgi:hypothetical protein